jgi:hypothetical protein
MALEYKTGDRVNLGSQERPEYATVENVTEKRILVSWDEGTGVVLLPRRLLELLAIGPEA